MWVFFFHDEAELEQVAAGSRGKLSLVVNGEVVGAFDNLNRAMDSRLFTGRDALCGQIGIRRETPDGPSTAYPSVAYILGAPLFRPPAWVATRRDPRSDRYLVLPPVPLTGPARRWSRQPWVVQHWDYAIGEWGVRNQSATACGEGAIIPLGESISGVNMRLSLDGCRVVSHFLCTDFTSYTMRTQVYVDPTLEGDDC